MFDIGIRGALIVDGSKQPPFEGEVAILGNRIAGIFPRGKDIQAKEMIDAKGQVLCPGFVDIHSHSDYFLLVNPSADAKLLQGVTTEIGGNCGYSAAPIWGEVAEQRRKDYQGLIDCDVGKWDRVPFYFEELERRALSLNYAHLVGHNTLRHAVSGVVNRRLKEEEMEALLSGLSLALEEGAFGVSTGLIYPPSCYADGEELIRIAYHAHALGGVFAFHMRSEGDGLEEAVEEVLAVGRATGCPVQISHLKTSGPANWPKIDGVLTCLEKAKKEGLCIGVDRYPYTASQTGLSAVLPLWAHEGGRKALVARLEQQDSRSKIYAELSDKHPIESGYFGRIRIISVKNKSLKDYEGKDLESLSKRERKDPITFLMDLLLCEGGEVPCIYFTMSEENLEKILACSFTSIGSDSACRATTGPLSEGSLHPRAFGTFPRILKKFVREKKMLSVEEAIHKMSALPCLQMGIPERGFIKESYFADLVIFDPDKISDLSDYDDPKQYPKGIEVVLVNGGIAARQGEVGGERRGSVLRKKGRKKRNVPS